MIFPIFVLGTCVLIILSLKDDKRVNQASATHVQGEVADLTPHLTEFTKLIRQGHKPSQWLVTEAVNEAFATGNWKLAKAISDAHPSQIAILRRKAKESSNKVDKIVQPETEEEVPNEPPKQLEFNTSKASSPVDGIPDDDWRMFIEASRRESAEFNDDSSIGMFRQNKKRLQKMGINPEDIKTPVDQYNAFETECVQLMNEGKDLIKQSVAMPVDVDGESVPITLSGLLSVMRHAGVQNASKWLDSPEERRRFQNTTEAFKRSNGCF